MGKEKYGVKYTPLVELLDQETATFDQISRAFKGASGKKIDIGSPKFETRFYDLIDKSSLSKEQARGLSTILERCAISLKDRNQKTIAEKYKDFATYFYHEGH